jgi:hypothetical protein
LRARRLGVGDGLLQDRPAGFVIAEHPRDEEAQRDDLGDLLNAGARVDRATGVAEGHGIRLPRRDLDGDDDELLHLPGERRLGPEVERPLPQRHVAVKDLGPVFREHLERAAAGLLAVQLAHVAVVPARVLPVALDLLRGHLGCRFLSHRISSFWI